MFQCLNDERYGAGSIRFKTRHNSTMAPYDVLDPALDESDLINLIDALPNVFDLATISSNA